MQHKGILQKICFLFDCCGMHARLFWSLIPNSNTKDHGPCHWWQRSVPHQPQLPWSERVASNGWFWKSFRMNRIILDCLIVWTRSMLLDTFILKLYWDSCKRIICLGISLFLIVSCEISLRQIYFVHSKKKLYEKSPYAIFFSGKAKICHKQHPQSVNDRK